VCARVCTSRTKGKKDELEFSLFAAATAVAVVVVVVLLYFSFSFSTLYYIFKKLKKFFFLLHLIQREKLYIKKK